MSYETISYPDCLEFEKVLERVRKLLTETSPQEGEEQREQDEGPVPLMDSCYGNHTQKEEDECLGDGCHHLDNVANGGAGSLRNILLHVVLHRYGACDDAV